MALPLVTLLSTLAMSPQAIEYLKQASQDVESIAADGMDQPSLAIVQEYLRAERAEATEKGCLPIAKEKVTIGGLKCDGIQTGTIYYPSAATNDNNAKYPLLSFAHGWTEGGTATARNYKDVLESVACAGYVVIAEESGLNSVCQVVVRARPAHRSWRRL